ncbi:MAG: DUF2344 domain-containing protein [Lachnospiraceae bacterium]|nr:DUF2344 domain-containing protein [Lachnospiraceae bacterium]
MRIRVKFSKTGSMRFLGHLDLMHFFQQLIRRSGIPIAYSQGMSPHQIMSFALPLGLGAESLGEYMDIEITEKIASKEALVLLNENSVPEIRILSFKELPEKVENAMASVTAADYRVSIKEGVKLSFSFLTELSRLLTKDTIPVLKKTKKNEREIDIKPFIYQCKPDGEAVNVRLSCGSVDNTKPELLMKALFEEKGEVFSEELLGILRLELYTGAVPDFVSLDAIGREIL